MVAPAQVPIDALLSAIPSLPRRMLDRLVTTMIDHLDTIDGDPDFEDGDEDRCAAGDDDVPGESSGAIRNDGDPGDPDDAEDDLEDCCPAGDDGIFSGGGPVLQRTNFQTGSDDDEEAEEGRPPEGAKKSRENHRRRIRHTRCRPIYYRRYRWEGGHSLEVDHYELLLDPTPPSLRTLQRRHPRLKRKRRR